MAERIRQENLEREREALKARQAEEAAKNVSKLRWFLTKTVINPFQNHCQLQRDLRV